MKIIIDGITSTITGEEARALERRGIHLRYNKSKDALVPFPVQIEENGVLRDTTDYELVTRKEAGEKFLKIEGKVVYVPVSKEIYDAVMRPVWRERKREERSHACIHVGKPCCENRDCDGCADVEYAVHSLDYCLESELDVVALPDVADDYCMKIMNRELREALAELDPVDREIICRTADCQSERGIAESLGFKSKNSVKKRKMKTIAYLQNRLKNFF